MDFERILNQVARATEQRYSPIDDPENEDEEQDEGQDADDMRDEYIDRDN